MTTYIPTKEELEELGFNVLRWLKGDDYDFILSIKKTKYRILYFWKHEWDAWFFALDDHSEWTKIFPQSLEDIKTLIRILTPQ